MLFPGRTDIHSAAEAIVVWPHHKAVNKSYFCPNLSCLSDDLLARRASSFRNVWLVTEEATDCTWLMMAEEPSCPHCGSTLCNVVEAPQTVKPLRLPWNANSVSPTKPGLRHACLHDKLLWFAN